MIPVLTKEEAYELDKDTMESRHLSQEECSWVGPSHREFTMDGVTQDDDAADDWLLVDGDEAVGPEQGPVPPPVPMVPPPAAGEGDASASPRATATGGSTDVALEPRVRVHSSSADGEDEGDGAGGSCGPGGCAG